jgi:SpoIID/LytB domain protein
MGTDWNEDMPIRIGVMEKQKEIKLSGVAPLLFSSTEKDIVLEGGQSYTLRVKSSKPATLNYYPVVRTVLEKKNTVLDEKGGVIDLTLTKWKKLGRDAKLYRAGGKIWFRKMLLHDNSRYYVTLEPFSTEAECEASFQSILQESEHKPWVLETEVSPSQGITELVDQSGKILATFTKPVCVTSRKPVKVFNVEFGVGYSWHGFEDREFRGIVELLIDKTGALQFVNELDIENYLKGVVPSEMSASYPGMALCAQAVAARGETLSKYGTRHLADPYFLCASQHCQVYGGLTKEHENTNKAVTDTSGRILRLGDRIADTVYSACCGGHTESNENVWSSEPSDALRGVPDLKEGSIPFPEVVSEENLRKFWAQPSDGWCSFSSPTYASRYRWTAAFTGPELDDFVKKKYPSVGSVKALIPLKRGVSGRMIELKIIGTSDTVIVQKELPIRFLFGVLKSAAFTIDSKKDDKGGISWTFTGAGWGHGVGMCQWGAKGLAEAGKTYRDILSHYFSNTHLLNVYRIPLVK